MKWPARDTHIFLAVTTNMLMLKKTANMAIEAGKTMLDINGPSSPWFFKLENG